MIWFLGEFIAKTDTVDKAGLLVAVTDAASNVEDLIFFLEYYSGHGLIETPSSVGVLLRTVFVARLGLQPILDFYQNIEQFVSVVVSFLDAPEIAKSPFVVNYEWHNAVAWAFYKLNDSPNTAIATFNIQADYISFMDRNYASLGLITFKNKRILLVGSF